MKDCYMTSCLNCNKEKAKKCDGFSESKDKIKYLLEDTNFSYILKLLGK